MMLRKQIVAVLLALLLVPVFALAQEKKATVEKYDKKQDSEKQQSY